MNSRTWLAIAPLLLLAPATAHAQNTSTPGAIELYPNVRAIGVRLAYTGDDNANATARLEWRPTSTSPWTTGVSMSRINGKRWAGSVLWLAPTTSYEVRAVITDPDGGGGAASASSTTRRDQPPAPSGRTWWVATNGNDGAAGTSTAPLRTLQVAANNAQPGDEIRVRPGIYYETLDAVRSGTATAPIHLVADAQGVVLDGSDPALLSRTDWRDDGGGVFSIPFTGATRLVCADSLQRLYRQANVAALRAGANGVAQGWTIETSRLWVRLEDGSSPVGKKMHIARLDYGVHMDVNHWVVKGLEIRYFGTTAAASGIYVRAANSCFLTGNYIHAIGGKSIYLRVLSANNMIASNTLRDPRISTWPWAACKGHEEEQLGISNRGGRGNVIENNLVTGLFDGIDVAGGEADENVGADCDIENNTVMRVSDDGLEPETIAGINVRVVRNRVDDVFSGMSVSPSYQGPTYVLYNSITNYRRSAIKLSLTGTGQVWICHNTFTSSVSPTAAVHPSGVYSNVHFRNNILVGNGAACVSDDAGESATGNDFDGDLIHSNYAALFRWKNTNYSTIAALRSATGFELNGVAGDPRFVSAATGNYALATGSIAIDAALRLPGINDAYRGIRPDMGAFEFLSGPPPVVDVTAPARILDLSAGQP